MSQQILNIGTANSGTGDTLRVAFTKVNGNFNELYTALTNASLKGVLGGTGIAVSLSQTGYASIINTLPATPGFSNIAVFGQTRISAASLSDTLNVAAGSNITLTTNPVTKTVTINSAGGININGNFIPVGGSVVIPTGTTAASSITGSTLANNVTGSSLTSVGTITTGTWNATPISNQYLANPALTINGVQVALGGTATIPSNVTAATLTGTTLNSNIVNSNLSSVGTITSGTWNGSQIANGYLANSAITINGTPVSLGGTITIQTSVSGAAIALTGTTLASNVINSSLTSIGTLTDLTVTNPIRGSITGNAGTVTNGVYTTVTYSNPSWLSTLSASKLTGTIASSSLPIATTNLAGAVKPDGTTITVGPDGSISSTPTSAANTLTGTTLASNVINSSLTSVGTLTDLTVTNPIRGSITGNAATVTNGIYYTGVYNNPSWIGTLAYSKITNVPVGSNSQLGIVEVDGTTITASAGVISAAQYTLPPATSLSLGGVKVDGTSIIINGAGIISAVTALGVADASVLTGTTLNATVVSSSLTSVGTLTSGTWSATTIAATKGGTGQTAYTQGDVLYSNGTNTLTKLGIGSNTQVLTSNGTVPYWAAAPGSYTLPIASSSTLGGVKVDGSTIVINGTGIISAPAYTLPTASQSTLGGVKVDGTSITISNGIISGSSSYSLPTATVGTQSTGTLGGVKVDGTTITISNGVISSASAYVLPTATNNTLGGVKVDGTSITISGGTISANASATRTTAQYTTNTLGISAATTATVAAAKGYVLYSIQVSAGAWVTVYTSSTAQSNDSARAITTDPTPGSGIIAEAITTTATTTYFTPAVYGYNADGTVSTNMYLKIYNNSGTAQAIQVTLTYLRLEV